MNNSYISHRSLDAPILQTVSNQVVTLKRQLSMLPIAQKLYVRTLSDICDMYKLFIQQYLLLDKKAIFVYTGKISCKHELLKDISP